MVPKTTNRTAGSMSFVNLQKRKLDFEKGKTGGKKKCVRKVNTRKFMSYSEAMSKNKLYYHMCPDGIIVGFAAKGKPDGPVGYMGGAVKAILKGLSEDDSKWKSLVDSSKISSALPVQDKMTMSAKVFTYAQGTKTMEVRGLVHVYNDVLMNDEENGNAWCTNLVNVLNANFNLNLAFGGNAAYFGSPAPVSLDKYFLSEDVATLAWNAYKEDIRDGSFFGDVDLVNKYFKYVPDVEVLFRNMYGI